MSGKETVPALPSPRYALIVLILSLTSMAAICWFILLPALERPLEMPLPITPKRVTSNEFQVNKPLPYRVGIQLNLEPPSPTLLDLIGENPESKTDPDDMILQLEWRLLSHGNVVASGKTTPEQGGPRNDSTFTKMTGHFQGQPNQPYLLEITVLRDLTPLEFAQPRAVVELSPMENQAPLLVAVGAYYLTICLAFGSLLALARVFYRRHKLNKVSTAARGA